LEKKSGIRKKVEFTRPGSEIKDSPPNSDNELFSINKTQRCSVHHVIAAFEDNFMAKSPSEEGFKIQNGDLQELFTKETIKKKTKERRHSLTEIFKIGNSENEDIPTKLVAAASENLTEVASTNWKDLDTAKKKKEIRRIL